MDKPIFHEQTRLLNTESMTNDNKYHKTFHLYIEGTTEEIGEIVVKRWAIKTIYILLSDHQFFKI